MQLFRSEEDVTEWSQATGTPVGAVFPPAQLWELAKRWYDDRFELDWVRRSPSQRQSILTGARLVGEFWRVEN